MSETIKAEEALRQLLTKGATWRDGSDFWKALVLLCAQERVTSPTDLVRVAGRFEQDYKRLTGATSMPTKYRSAKTVVGQAVRYSVQLVDKNGTPRGKTEIEKDVRERAS